MWGTMLVATFYPIIDGGIQQIAQIYRGLGKDKNKTIESATPSGSSVDESARVEQTKGESEK